MYIWAFVACFFFSFWWFSAIFSSFTIILVYRSRWPDDYFWKNTSILLSPFHLQMTASVRKLTLWATWATIAATSLPAAAVHEPTLLSATERGFICWKDFSESYLTNFYSKMQVKESWSNDFLESLYLLVETSRNKQK